MVVLLASLFLSISLLVFSHQIAFTQRTNLISHHRKPNIIRRKWNRRRHRNSQVQPLYILCNISFEDLLPVHWPKKKKKNPRFHLSSSSLFFLCSPSSLCSQLSLSLTCLSLTLLSLSSFCALISSSFRYFTISETHSKPHGRLRSTNHDTSFNLNRDFKARSSGCGCPRPTWQHLDR